MIENIRSDYNFGAEVEMNGITRREAAKLAAAFFGIGRYENTASQNGYSTWSAWDGQGREWKFSKDVSIAGPDDQKCELVTPILAYDDIPTIQELLRKLRSAGAVSNPSVGAGVHIHVSRKDGFEPKDIRNLVNMMASHEAQLARAIRIDEGRINRYCKVVDANFLNRMNTERPQTMEAIEDIWYESQGEDYGRTRHYNGSRYHMLNLHSFFHGHGTIEFRLFQFDNPHDGKKGGIHAGEMKAFIQLCLAMCEAAHEAARVSARPQQTENEKYAFRCWLLRLGMIGDEFKTAREVLTRNLSGNSAWRSAAI